MKDSKKTLKKYKSAYIFYCEEVRPKFIENNPGLSSQKITALMGKTWKELKDKEKYFELQEKDKLNFHQEKEKGASLEYRTLKKKCKMPKRYKTAFMIFMQENKDYLHARNRESNIEAIRELSKLWKSFTAQQKEKYVELSNQDKERYCLECKEYLYNSVISSEKQKRKKKNNSEENN